MEGVLVEKVDLGEIVHLLYSNKEWVKSPLVIICHGWNNDKYEGSNLVLNLALQGYSVICFDSDSHGERNDGNAQSMDSHSRFIKRVTQVIKQNANDIDTLIKHYQEDIRIDPSRIALVGISMGAMSTFYSLTQNNQIKAAVPILGSPDFVGLEMFALEAGSASKVLSDDEKRAIQYMAEIDPYLHLVNNESRAMLLINGRKDDWVPSNFAEKFYKSVRSKYGNANTEIEFYLADESHYFPNDMRDHTIRWLNKHL
ncbi:prolyl oligopeptidase family serine peptidase [Vibrio sp. Isolate31]|uniref:alpha/beta hydrolase family protein n=1 Tax=unclassified Vibrio TaxID=2614977 RepID=UPI001EFDB3FC|nr:MULTISPECIES: alpha/beta fold hydrolase [unclassified Vibrio]MCG9552573.1 prolyl oligopeptidase family serine peptidase [Vibrio sp. Isolate32]MCG9600717.1 prolyl oligopeptidase family serine peptidase [Vibrio sp. Isolate31]